MLSTYLSYGSSFKSGGFNTRYNAPTADNLPVPFDKEQVATWEIGVKADLADKLRVKAASFATLGYAEAIYARPRNVLLAFSIDF